MVEAVEDFQGFHVNVAAGDGVFWPGNDARRGLRRLWKFVLHKRIIKKNITFFNPLFRIIMKYLLRQDSPGKKSAGRGIIDKRFKSIYF
jgi:hypothetical protein